MTNHAEAPHVQVPSATPLPSRVRLLGVDFDALTLADTVQRIRHAAASRQRLFVSTVNVNFVVLAARDAAFRRSLEASDLCVADGAPLVWLSRFLARSALPERVAGADVFQALAAHPAPPLRVYLFGGPPGVAQEAAATINARGSGLLCVGYDSPGFGDVASMSAPEQIDPINAARPDLLVVALGAQKGQAWILHNLYRLEVPVVSHLGAVVNFAAGRLARAPAWVAQGGFEWLWRIGQEPALWRRYTSDGWRLLGLVWRDWLRRERP